MGEGRRDCVLRRRRLRHRLAGWIHQNGVDVRELPAHPQESGKLCRSGRAHRSGKHLVFHAGIRVAVEDAGDKLSRAGRRKRIGIAVEHAQQLGSKADESNDLRPDPGADGPLPPFLRIHFKIEVDKAIPQRSGHPRGVCPVCFPVSRSDDYSVTRQHVLPEPAVKYKLIERHLDHCRRRIQLVKK